ncbi:hypothetical protein GOP47_0028940 [Adiantum capillus-veneris]|nr:hypothetical protein GOP47_0028940 [Adiantum capillus-veneris]
MTVFLVTRYLFDQRRQVTPGQGITTWLALPAGSAAPEIGFSSSSSSYSSLGQTRKQHKIIRESSSGNIANPLGKMEVMTFESLVRKITSLSLTKKSTIGDIQHLSYVSFVQIVSNEDDATQLGYEDDQDGESVDEPSENVEDDQGMSLEHLIQQIEEAKKHVQAGTTLDTINHQWLEYLLQVAECSLLMSSLESTLNWSCLSTSSLRVALRSFFKSKTKSDRNQAGHLFGSLLSRDFLAESSHAKHVHEVGSGEAPLYLPWKPSETLTMEQPLFGPKAFNCNLSNLEDGEDILDDIWNDQERSLRSLQEDVSRASELLTIVVNFWRKGVSALKQKRQSRNKKKTRSKKKARHQ